jgi:aspartyl-tRNA(Asn)/glutamyl-tRNA(Gln) amidotransferase subunit C
MEHVARLVATRTHAGVHAAARASLPARRTPRVCYLSGMPDAGPDTLTDADIRKIAKLSRLSMTDAQTPVVRTQLASILGHIAKLQALPTEGVEPMAHPMKIVNRLGADEPKACMPVEELLKNAPAVEDRYLAVPKVLGEGGGA